MKKTKMYYFIQTFEKYISERFHKILGDYLLNTFTVNILSKANIINDNIGLSETFKNELINSVLVKQAKKLEKEFTKLIDEIWEEFNLLTGKTFNDIPDSAIITQIKDLLKEKKDKPC